MTPEDHLRAFLDAVGWSGDPELSDTPRRVAELYRDMATAAPPTLTVFDLADSGPVVLRDLPFHSLCAHHLLPFFGTADIAYQPAGRVVGFSCVARALRYAAERPQLQERLARDLARDLSAALAPAGLVVRLRARQLCMEMRGARTPGAVEVWAGAGDQDPLRALVAQG